MKTLISIQPDLMHNYRTCQPSDLEGDMCFEILGFDIYIDSKCRPWLLEVNLAPSFECGEEIDKTLKYPLIWDAFILLNATHKEWMRKQVWKWEEMQRWIMEWVSFKDNMIKM